MKNLIFVIAFLACLSTPAFAEDQKDEVTSDDAVIEKTNDSKEVSKEYMSSFDFISVRSAAGGGDAVSP